MTKETCLYVERDGPISRNRRIVQLSIQQSLAISVLSKKAVFKCQKTRVLYVKRAVFIRLKSRV